MKKLVEKLSLFCKRFNIKLIISRPFNIYGKNDKYSIIQKLKKIIKKNSKLTIFNNGNSIMILLMLRMLLKYMAP